MKKLEITEKRYIANVTNSIKGGEANKIKYKEMFEKSEPRFCKCCGKQFTYAERTKGTYCSRSCAAKINNKGRIHSLASKEKVRETMKKWAAEKYRVPKIHECKCVVCDTLFVHKVKTTKTCSVQCLKKMSSKNGIKAGRLSTVSFLNRRCRSKIEIQFAELLKQYFPDILTNKRIFFEYDADIIIPSLKLAIKNQ